jgi:thiamine-phosphate pyrophosphorylase
MAKTDIFFFTPAIADVAGFQPRLEAALRALRPASVFLRGAAGFDPKVAQALGPAVTAAGAALLVEPPEDWREVARSGADGVHLSDPRQLDAGLEALKPQRIVGVGSVKTRDAAMTVGESGADYLMFGEVRADGSLPPLEQVIERCQWWAEVFTIPCIGYAPDLVAVPRLVATGAEFVALGPWLFEGSVDEITQRCASVLAALNNVG